MGAKIPLLPCVCRWGGRAGSSCYLPGPWERAFLVSVSELLGKNRPRVVGSILTSIWAQEGQRQEKPGLGEASAFPPQASSQAHGTNLPGGVADAFISFTLEADCFLFVVDEGPADTDQLVCSWI